MHRHLVALLSAVLALAATAHAQSAKPLPSPLSLPLPDGKAGIGFDDLRYDATLNRLLIPAGRTGNVDLIDPATLTATNSTAAIVPVPGFTKIAALRRRPRPERHVRRRRQRLSLRHRSHRALARRHRSEVAPHRRPRCARQRARLRALRRPDARDLGDRARQETHRSLHPLRDHDRQAAQPTHAAFIDAPGGPESLAIDATRGRAYTHKWKTSTMAIDLRSRAIVATWPAGCADPRGIALDSARALLFIGCEDGTATALDVAHDGKLVGSVKSGSGVDIIAYDAGRAHLYVPGDESATLAIIGVASSGALSLLGTAPTTKDAHCVTSDERGNAYVCDPRNGQLLVVHDPYPPQK